MARLTFPSDRDVRLSSPYRGAAFVSAAGLTVTVYSDSAGTVLADVQNADGSANAAATFTVDTNSELPLFLGPAAGSDTLYVKVNNSGAPVVPVYAIAPSDVSAAVATEVTNRTAADAAHVAASDPHGDRASASTALTAHASNVSNPHAVTKAQVGLGNADNTTDAGKPVSTAQQAALDAKAPLASPALTGTPTVNGATVEDRTHASATYETLLGAPGKYAPLRGSLDGRSRIFIPASQLALYSGAPTAAVFSDWPSWTLPHSSTNGVYGSAILPPEWSGAYKVFVWWSNASAATGTVRFDLAAGARQLVGDTVSAPGSNFVTITAGAQNVVMRTQVGTKFSGGGFGIARCRVRRIGGDGADTLTGSIAILGLEIVPALDVPAKITDATLTDQTGATVTSHTTAYDGTRAPSSLSIYTPIWSTATHIFACSPVTIGGVEQSRLARYDKSYNSQQDVQLLAAAHNSSLGHRWPSVAVDANGTLVAYPETHQTAWAGKHTTSAEDLTTLAATTAPASTASSVSYRRFFRNPADGSLWLTIRGDGLNTGVYTWNNTTKTWTQVAARQITGTDVAYGGNLAFTNAGVVYLMTEWYDGTPGWPRRDMGIVKSSDSGATWYTMDGSLITLPVTSSNQQSIFPTESGDYNGVVAAVGVDAAGNPLAIASWKHPGESYRSLWQGKWNATTKKFDLSRIIAGTTRDVGLPQVGYTAAGRIVVAVGKYDDHDPTTGAETATSTPTGPLWMLVTDDGGTTWKRYTIDDGTGATAWNGSFIDPESFRIDGVWRLLPVSTNAPTAAKILEVTLP